MTNRSLGSAAKNPETVHRRFHAVILMIFAVAILGCGFVWLVPLEVVQQRALNRAGTDRFAQFEAMGEAEFSIWLLRISLTLLVIVIWWIWWDLDRWLAWLPVCWRGLIVSTSQSADGDSTSVGGRGSCRADESSGAVSELRLSSTPARRDKDGFALPIATSLGQRIRTLGWRAMLVAWMILFVVRFVHAIGERIHEWPVFRFKSGDVVLPNISDSNRAVIRYLERETPPNARILVASDQKLFFLSYYLRPRILLHRMHPEAEHVIPLKEQQRKLNAYQLNELTNDDLEQMPHDYTLEYFEHPDLVDRSKVLDDTSWVSFIRQRQHNPTLIPSYVVRLKAVKERGQ